MVIKHYHGAHVVDGQHPHPPSLEIHSLLRWDPNSALSSRRGPPPKMLLLSQHNRHELGIVKPANVRRISFNADG